VSFSNNGGANRPRFFDRQGNEMTFTFIGKVIHHMQDMAQPEHVRNDQHLVPRSKQ
jgi:hypothetical protein